MSTEIKSDNKILDVEGNRIKKKLRRNYIVN